MKHEKKRKRTVPDSALVWKGNLPFVRPGEIDRLTDYEEKPEKPFIGIAPEINHNIFR